MSDWKQIAGWPNYLVSNCGQIKNRVTGKILRPGVRSGYDYVVLCRDGIRHKSAAVHRMVASAFCIKPRGKVEVNHRNGNKRDNNASNLEWLTRSDNQKHAADSGLKACGTRSHLCTKLIPEFVWNIRKLYADGYSQQRIAQFHGVSQSHVGKIVRNEKWRNA